MKHMTKEHIDAVSKKHPMLGKMIKKCKTPEEHHFLGSLIGMAARALPMITKGVGAGARMAGTGAKLIGRNAKNIGHAVNAGAGIASGISAYRQGQAANKAAAAQERMMNAQAEGQEAQNAYMRRQMEAQPQRKGGRTKSRI